MRIVYVDLDSLRPDHTGPYGYRRPLTPNLDSVANRGVTFERYYTSDSPCVPSRAALTTQRFGITTGAFGHQGADADVRFPPNRSHPPDAPFLGGHLARSGYHTAGISCFAERHLAYWFHGNFMEFHRPSSSLGLDEDAAEVTDAAIDWLRRRGQDDDWFLFVNYWDTHTEYFVDQEWVDKAAASGPPPDWPDEATIAAHQEVYGAHSAVDLHGGFGDPSRVPHSMPDAIRDRADFEHLINGYDATVAYWDHHFGRLLEELRDLGLLEDTAIIVSADHGEAFGEHGLYAEHGLAHEPAHRIPLVVAWPGLTEGLADEDRTHPGLFYSLDLGPTLCDLLGIETPVGWHGRSFADAIRGRPQDGRPYLVLSHGVHSFQRAVRTPDLLYIRTLHPGSYRVDPEELYEIERDPRMTRNLMAEQPARAADLKVMLSDWWHTYAGAPGAPVDPMQAALERGPVLYTDPKRYLARLEETGRSHLAADYRARLGAFLTDEDAVPAHELPKDVLGGRATQDAAG